MSQYWFRRKRIGIGAVPSSWEGWLATVVYIAMTAGLIYGLRGMHTNPTRSLILAAGVIALTAIFILLTVLKGDHVWGGDPDSR